MWNLLPAPAVHAASKKSFQRQINTAKISEVMRKANMNIC